MPSPLLPIAHNPAIGGGFPSRAWPFAEGRENIPISTVLRDGTLRSLDSLLEEIPRTPLIMLRYMQVKHYYDTIRNKERLKEQT
ncbi:Hypothetical predicted protein [Pelobates cultripes]|uniref:Uncharacterized protein n=1 Tax=Pelobates cultripes TaxID=61616 RepID=A0AAD1S8P4_PELCU|nr:Hypothetical predicted protein [Pelobates cultripes]